MPPTTRFAILVPAHDEERLIATTVRSLLAIDYPEDLFEVHVVADHCTDRTVEIVRDDRRRGPRARRSEPAARVRRWRGCAPRLDERGTPHDVVVVIDADSIVDPRVPPRARRPIRRRRPRRPGPLRACAMSSESASAGVRAAALGAAPLRAAARPERARCLVRPVRQRHGVRVRRPATPHDERSPHRGPRAADGARPRRRSRRLRPRRRRRGRDPGDARGVTDPERALGTRAHRSRQTLRSRPCSDAPLDTAAGSGWSPIDAALDHAVPPLSVLAAVAVGLRRLVRRCQPSGADRASCEAGARASRFALAGLAVHVVLGLRVARAPRAVYRSLLLAPRRWCGRSRCGCGCSCGPERSAGSAPPATRPPRRSPADVSASST